MSNRNSDTIDFILEIGQHFLGGLSLISNLFIILLFVMMKKKNFTFELFIYLAFASIINNISHFLVYIKESDTDETRKLYFHSPLCETQSILMIFSEMSVVIIGTIISIYCYYVAKDYYNNNDEVEQDSYLNKRILVIIFGYFVPIIACLVFYFCDILGPNQIWCWFREDIGKETTNYFVYQIYYYIFIWILICLNIFYILIALFLKTDIRFEDDVHRKNYVKSLLIYPFLCFFTWLPATLDRIFFIYFDKKWEEAFEFINVVLFQLQGFTFALFFICNNWIKVKKIFLNMCRNKRKIEIEKVDINKTGDKSLDPNKTYVTFITSEN